MKLYAVRGLNVVHTNSYPSDEVWISRKFGITMLTKVSSFPDIWKPTPSLLTRDYDVLCYEGFSKVTGIILEPGEYTTLEVTSP